MQLCWLARGRQRKEVKEKTKIFEEQERKFADTLINHDQLNRLFVGISFFVVVVPSTQNNLSHMLGARDEKKII